MKKIARSTPQVTTPAPLRVWAERRPDPDWDRFLAGLVALAMRRVEEEDAKEERD